MKDRAGSWKRERASPQGCRHAGLRRNSLLYPRFLFFARSHSLLHRLYEKEAGRADREETAAYRARNRWLPGHMESYTHVPSPPLSAFVDRLWCYEGYESPHPKERAFPTGSLDLVINLTRREAMLY